MKDNILLKTLFLSLLAIGIANQPSCSMENNLVPTITEKQTPKIQTMQRILGNGSKLFLLGKIWRNVQMTMRKGK